MANTRLQRAGLVLGSQTLDVERSANGLAYFAFNFPKEFTDASSKRIKATVRSR